ncbi:hypothetical protein FRC91_15305 [Bradymonadales bacterium TMQ1]|nr:hypothetical protein FRC91_15305 [Bradymonadales bacterium TMQ1]
MDELTREFPGLAGALLKRKQGVDGVRVFVLGTNPLADEAVASDSGFGGLCGVDASDAVLGDSVGDDRRRRGILSDIRCFRAAASSGEQNNENKGAWGKVHDGILIYGR